MPAQSDVAIGRPNTLLGVQRQVFWLGVVSFFTDLSSEMIFSVLAVFLSVILGASALTIGLMEGLADFASSSLDWISGYLSDRSGRRKPFVVAGYGFSALAKTALFPAQSVAVVFAFRIVERLGKSVRGAPRDALISSVADSGRAGYAFGFHKALDRLGAVVGPLCAYFLLGIFGQKRATFVLLFAAAAVFSWIAVLVLVVGISDTKAGTSREHPGLIAIYRTMDRALTRYLGVAAFFSLGYFGFAFLFLKANQVGFQIKDVALLYAGINTAAVVAAIPLGHLGDRVGRKWLIGSEYLLYAGMCLGFVYASSKAAIIVLFLVYGIFLAIDEGQTKAYIGDLAVKEAVGSAMGLYGFITGLAYLPASVVAGALWKFAGSGATFLFGAVVASISFLLFCFLAR
jgi:MFS family permease